MAETLLSFGVEKLCDLLVREAERFQGVHEQLTALKSELNTLRCFLEDADAKKHVNASVRNCVEEIKEIVYDAEDVIESFVLKNELGKTGGIKCLKRLSCVVLDRREVASDMEGISKRISKVIDNMKHFGVQQTIVDGSRCSETLQERQREMRHTFPRENEIHLVGLEQKVKKLVGYLIEEESTQVVSVIGMARQVFNHETIKEHFDGVVWVCVSQQFTRKYVWQTILEKLSSKHDEHGESNMTEDKLHDKLFQMLETKKCLIVLDDMWKEEDWDIIKPVFPPTKGWRVLLTSRKQGVASHADPKCVIFRPEFLIPEESWTLFQRIAFPVKGTTEYNIDEMEEMGKQMLKHCGGLPLAIKVLGGLLAEQFTSREWKRLLDNIGSHILRGTSDNDKNISSVYHILYLSFEELPVYLKHCFLYLAPFPEDYLINVGILSYYWAAERIPRPRHYNGASIQDVADGYIDELVKRNMVISERDVMTSRFERCQLHDMMREVCLLKAEEENFLQIVQGTITAESKSLCKSRRLAIHGPVETSNVETEVKNPSLRTLLFLKSEKWKATDLFFTKLKLIRVLDLSHAMFEGGKLPSCIGKLIHLRYLSLHYANVTHLPSSMRNLKQLLYLNLHVFGEVYMPNFLKEMRELTYLYLPSRIKNKVKMELVNLVNLERLENFSTEHGRVTDLKCMTRLRTLSIKIRGEGCNMNTLSSSLSEQRCLENLTIHKIPMDNDDEEGIVLDCVRLKDLNLMIYMPRLPDEQHFPTHLTTIVLRHCRLEEDPMPTLGKLLHLKMVWLMERSFCGRRMVCSRGGFPQLQELGLWALNEWDEWLVEEGSMPLLCNLTIMDCSKWDEWIVEEGSMPLLCNLTIMDCSKLKEFPDRLRFITSLKYFTLTLSGEEWKKKLSKVYLPSLLTSIELKECRLEEDPMPILEKLLHLKTVWLKERSFCGRRMVCSRGEFPKLQMLIFDGLDEWEEWIVEEGCMPFLRNLTIWACSKLKELPDGLRFITSLTQMKIYNMGEEWKKRLSEGGEDSYKVQHIPSIIFKTSRYNMI